ncbi:MAG: T9SS type A sorting domain-containing protein [Flavobacteriales bacterium]|nr:T9SS type A sorting domain-containing protein [Flavobacteriales bacterium]
MRSTLHLLHALLVCTAPLAHGQGFGELDINMIRARLHAHGLIGASPGTNASHFEVPQGSGRHTLYNAGMWISGISSSSMLHLAAQQFEGPANGDFWPGPLGTGGTITAAVSMQYDRVWTVHRAEIDAHRAYFDCLSDPLCDVNMQFPGGYTIPPDFISWPAMGDVSLGQSTYLAPFTDYDGDGAYDAAAGDHPCVPGDMAVFFIYNDAKPHLHTQGQPIGMEIHCMAYAFDSPDPALAHTMFLHYRLFNRGTLTLTSTYQGFYADFDLGNPMDDHIGTDARRNMIYVYNADNDDESSFSPGYGPQPPAFGMVQLKGTLVDTDGLDNSPDGLLPSFNGVGFADGSIDNERYGFTVTKTYTNSGGAMGDPTLSFHFRNHMTGYWNDGTPQLYGGNGHISDPNADPLTPSKFCFPDISDPVGAGTAGVPQAPWSEITVGNPGGDRRILATQGPFTLEPGDARQVHMAFVYARAASGGPWASVQALQARTDSVQEYFMANLNTAQGDAEPWCPVDFAQGVTVPSGLSTDLQVYPVPARDVLFIKQSGRSMAAEVQVFDAVGRGVVTGSYAHLPSQVSIATLTPGHYVLVVRTAEGTRHARFVKE